MRSVWIIILHSIISLTVFLLGLYVLIEKKMIISGKLTGDLYQFDYPGNVIIALSFFIVSAFMVVVLLKGKKPRKIAEWLLITALLLFVVGAFI